MATEKAIGRGRHADKHKPASNRPLATRLAWFVALWLAGVGAVGTVALILRAWIGTG